jgi:pectate lyase
VSTPTAFASGSSSGAGTRSGARRLLAERVGFGRAARGGDPGLVYRVTTLSDSGSGSLRRACESDRPYWIVFAKSGTIKLRSRLRIRANKTLDGRGRNVVIKGEVRLEGVRNVIINDLAITSPKNDAILLTGNGGSSVRDFEVRDVWLHHLELYDSEDGLVDLRGATDVTVSWCHFRDHAKVALMWKEKRGRSAKGMRVTMHHNFFDGTTRRNPSFNYGKLDFFNNYVSGFWEYGLGYYEDSRVLSEGNIYSARRGWINFGRDPNSGDYDFFVKKGAVINDWAGRRPGKLRSVGDARRNGAKIVTRGEQDVFSRSTYYRLTPEAAGDRLQQKIVNGVGPR